MYKDKYILEWMVDSLLKIEECRILYRVARVSAYSRSGVITVLVVHTVQYL